MLPHMAIQSTNERMSEDEDMRVTFESCLQERVTGSPLGALSGF
jgi:hypothetical protein